MYWGVARNRKVYRKVAKSCEGTSELDGKYILGVAKRWHKLWKQHQSYAENKSESKSS